VRKKVFIVIPARYASSRFPGKVLALLAGKPVIQHVYERAVKTNADKVLIAVDDEKVERAVRAFGGEPVMTPPELPSGTDRIQRAVIGRGADIIVNIQGDEPLVPAAAVNMLIAAMTERPDRQMATVVSPCRRDDIASNPNIVKAVLDKNSDALYFSRSMIPFLRSGGEETEVYRHWGLYAYTRETLDRFVTLPEGALERCEKLEQLRALENGIKIHAVRTELESSGIDTPEDLAAAEKLLKERSL
jgi:3-deoxy-manno-octulosonate cytidylyltransferase (CMP-KDO synthetase)